MVDMLIDQSDREGVDSLRLPGDEERLDDERHTSLKASARTHRDCACRSHMLQRISASQT